MQKLNVSSRALNPLTKKDNPLETFCDKSQAKATTATKFFRDDEMLKALKGLVIPRYLQKNIKHGLDVWSAGCSSGEEVYSLACIGLYMFKYHKERSNFTVYGTDISAEQLSKGKVGRYLKNSSSTTLDKYRQVLLPFATVSGEVIQMGREIRSAVKFGKFDLRKCPRKHTFDYISCNHVFQYYDDESQVNFAHNFISVLKPGGLIFIKGLTAYALSKIPLNAVAGYKNLYSL